MKKFILALGFTGALFVASPASAADCTFSTPDVADSACSNDTDPGAVDPNGNGAAPGTNGGNGGGTVQVQSAAPAVSPASRSQLPVTGVETASIALAGLAMVAGGAVMVTRSKDEASA